MLEPSDRRIDFPNDYRVQYIVLEKFCKSKAFSYTMELFLLIINKIYDYQQEDHYVGRGLALP